MTSLQQEGYWAGEEFLLVVLFKLLLWSMVRRSLTHRKYYTLMEALEED